MAKSSQAVHDLFPSMTGLPPMPPASLDPILDAVSRCFARYGVRRTSVQDVAQELGVNRTTVYRQAGNVARQAILLATREAYRLVLKRAPARLAEPLTPEVVVDILATAVNDAREHPVLAKMLADERDLIGSLLAADAETLIRRISEAAAPLLALGMAAGHLARREPLILADWLVRIAASLMLLEPPADLKKYLAEVLLPVLTPSDTP